MNTIGWIFYQPDFLDFLALLNKEFPEINEWQILCRDASVLCSGSNSFIPINEKVFKPGCKYKIFVDVGIPKDPRILEDEFFLKVQKRICDQTKELARLLICRDLTASLEVFLYDGESFESQAMAQGS